MNRGKAPGRGPGGGGPGGRAPAEKPKDFKGSGKRLLSYFKPFRLQIILTLVLLVLSNLFNLLSPRIIANAIDLIADAVRLQIPLEMQRLLSILTMLAVVYLLSAGFQLFQQRILVKISNNLAYSMRREFNEKLGRLPLSYFDSNERGDIMSRATNDIDNVQQGMQQGLSQILSSVITCVGVLVMMLLLSPLMTLVVVVSVPLLMFISVKVMSHSQKYFTEQWSVMGSLNGHVEEMYTGHQIVRLFGKEQQSVDQFVQTNQNLYDVSWKAQFITGIIHPLMNFINNLVYVILCVIGALRVIGGAMTVGDVTAFLTYVRQFTQPLTQVANVLNMLQSSIASAERIFKLLDEPEEVPDAPDALVLTDPHGNIAFEHVRFGYQPDKVLMHDLSIDVRQGQTIAIVGPTGAGKTTLVNLLMRFYEIQSGKITMDGIDTRHITRDSLRGAFGMVLQDAWLFAGTIRDNIAYGKPDATDEEIVAATKAAYMHRYVRTLPDGYDTLLSEDASNISQGQKQLLTIARTLLVDPEVLILDEATSSVDTRTEVLIQKAMKKLMQNRTSFIIAHRLSTIRNADLILVMNEGNIVEQGTHAQLMEQRGFYANLYNSQFPDAKVG